MCFFIQSEIWDEVELAKLLCDLPLCRRRLIGEAANFWSVLSGRITEPNFGLFVTHL